VSAVLAYAEATGATIVAEGIETPQQVAVAQSMGAVIGQGWHLGPAGRLPPGLVSPATPLRLLEPFDAPTSDRTLATPFSIITARRPAARITKRLLMPLSRFLESRVAGDEEPPVLLACFQEARHFTEQVAFRFSTVAQRSPLVAAIAVGLSDEPAKGVRGARLGADDPLRGEWNVVVVGPHYAAALTAIDVGDTGADNDRRFDFVITHDRPLVIEAARSLLRCLTPASASQLGDTPIAT
jgi:hypothetical protein